MLKNLGFLPRIQYLHNSRQGDKIISVRVNTQKAPIKINQHGLYETTRKPSRLEAFADAHASEKKALHQAQASFALSEPQVKAIPQALPFYFFQNSKIFHRLILGPSKLIEFPRTKNIVIRNNYKNNGRIDALQNDAGKNAMELHRLLIPQELVPERIHSTLPEFLVDLATDEELGDFVFKGDMRARARGLVKITRTPEALQLKLLNPEFDYVPFEQTSLGRVVQYLDDENLAYSDNGSIIAIELRRDNPDLMQHLGNILVHSLLEYCPAKEETTELPAIKPHFAEYSGIYEDWHNFVRIDDKVIEGRYFYDLTNEPEMCKGHRASGEMSPSFMKIGTNEDLVNAGDELGQWPNMHQALIDELKLDCTEAEFNEYMARLTKSIATEFKNQFGMFCVDPEFMNEGLKDSKLTIDIAWEANERQEVPINGKTIVVPKPRLIEMHLSHVNREALKAKAKELGIQDE